MLAGLLFAIEEAADRSTRLLATLPFAGTTIVEHQARQLIAAGADQIVVFGDSEDPALQGALQRVRRRGVAVDAVASAADAAAALHPLARLLMVADGLVTTDRIIAALARDEGEALLIVPADTAPRHFERIGGAGAWAGLARVDARRIGELAALPGDYAPQSTVLRLIESAGAARLSLGEAALADGHDIVVDAASLDESSRRRVAAAVRPRRDWYDRWLATPLTRFALPSLLARRVGTAVVASVAAGLGVVALLAIGLDRFGLGLAMVFVATLAGAIGVAMAGLRDEAQLHRWLRTGVLAVTGAAALLLGWRCDVVRGDGSALPVAVALVTATVLVERTGAAPARWWGGAASCTLVVAAATWLGWPVVGLALAALYVLATLAMAIERLRRGLARP